MTSPHEDVIDYYVTPQVFFSTVCGAILLRNYDEVHSSDYAFLSQPAIMQECILAVKFYLAESITY